MVCKKRNLLVLVVVGVLIIFSSFVFAVAVSDDLHVNIQVAYDNGSVQVGSFVFVFNVSPSADCSGVVYTDSATLTTDSRGVVSHYLEDVTLNYSNQYWLCYYLDGVLKNASKLANTPYAFYAKNVSVSGIMVDSNLDMVSSNISTTGWFKGLFNWIIGVPSRIYLSFNGTTLEFNETRLNLTIDNKISDAGVSLSYYPTSVNLTTGTQNGNLGGYASADTICDSNYSGSHMCNEFEVMNWFSVRGGGGITGDAWIKSGSPKYIPASVPVNDCNGWTYSGTVSYLGNYWHFNTTEGGDGRALNCGSNLKLACCSY